jgi:hypothetical protein
MSRSRVPATVTDLEGAFASSPQFARVSVATSLCGLSRATLYREAGRGNIIMKKAGRTTLVCLTSLRAYLDRLPRAEIRPPQKRVG